MDSSFRADILLVTNTNFPFIKALHVLTQGRVIPFQNTDTYLGPAGGIVFYDKGNSNDGWRFLEAAPTNREFTAIWGSTSENIAGTLTAIGTGRNNTNLIVDSQGGASVTGTAAQRCAALNINGFSDWFLPSRDELNLMYQNRSRIGGFQNAWYWSSSQSNTSNALYQHFSNGNQSNYYKSSAGSVRAVRAF
jgi:hypothetical protein